MPCCCGKCRCLKVHDYADPTFRFSAWVKMPGTKTGFHFNGRLGMDRDESLETDSYFLWTTSHDADGIGNPPYYILGALRLGKTGSRRPRFLVLISDSSAPTIADARDLDSMPTGVEGALYECGKNGWTLLDYTEYTGPYYDGATDYRFGVKFEGSNVDAVGQNEGTTISSSVFAMHPVNILCRSPLPMFSPSDPPTTIQIQFSGWGDETAYLNGLTTPMIPIGIESQPIDTQATYERYTYWLGNPAGDSITDQIAVGLPGHEIFPLGTNAWTWDLNYYKPVGDGYVPLVVVHLCWHVCTAEFELNGPPGTFTGNDFNGFSVKGGWYFWSQFDHPDDTLDKAHWVGKSLDIGSPSVIDDSQTFPVYMRRHNYFNNTGSEMGTVAFVQ